MCQHSQNWIDFTLRCQGWAMNKTLSLRIGGGSHWPSLIGHQLEEALSTERDGSGGVNSMGWWLRRCAGQESWEDCTSDKEQNWRAGVKNGTRVWISRHQCGWSVWTNLCFKRVKRHIIRREEVGRQSEYQQEMVIKLSLTDRMLPGRFEIG